MSSIITKYFKKDKDRNARFFNLAYLIERLEFLKDVKLENVSPALAAMYVQKSDYISDLAGGFNKSIIEAENDDRLSIFLEYYNLHKTDVSDKLKEHCKANIDLIRTIISDNKELFTSVSIPTDLLNIFTEFKRVPIGTVYEARNKIDAVGLMARSWYQTKTDGDFNGGENSSITIDEALDIIDHVANQVKLDYDITTSKICNDWIYLQSRLHLVLMHLFVREGCTHDVYEHDTNTTDARHFVSNIPSLTPEGMISIWDVQEYPTLLTRFSESNLPKEEVESYITHLFNWHSAIDE